MTIITDSTSASEGRIEDRLYEEAAHKGISRRAFLKGTGVLIVGLGMGGFTRMLDPTTAAADFSSIVDPSKLGSWLAIGQDNSVTLFFGKVDVGQGLFTAFRQLVADELDIPMERVKVVVGDTAVTVDQVGASGSTGLALGSPPVRVACAEARLVLLELASARLGVPVEQLTVHEGFISVRGAPSKRVSYGELIGGQRFTATLQWNGELGRPLSVTGRAQPKKADQLKVVGQSIPRDDIPSIVFGAEHHVTDVRLPGMVHARSIKPPVAGARPVRVDASSVGNVPGVVKVVTRGDYVGVVCEREEHAIRAAEQLKITWSEPSAPSFPTDWIGLFDYIRQAPSRSDTVVQNVGNVDEAFARAARVVQATYEVPLQAHASMGPACAVADWRNGEMTVWSGTQKPYGQREGLATFLGLPREKVRVIWKPGPGSFGRNDAGDVAFEAALLAREVGRPVRLQWMRHEAIAWDPKSPAALMSLRGAFDSAGNVIAFDWDNRSFSHQDVAPAENPPGETLVGQFLGFKREVRNVIGTPSEPYTFPNRRHTTHAIPPLKEMGSPLRTAHLRLPTGSVVTFASESFIDELAAAGGADPIQFRLRYLDGSRQATLLKAAAEAAGWDTRPSPKPGARADGAGVVTGRGIAVRGGAATVAEVEVHLETGRVRVTRFVCAHACGLIVNPDGLKNVIEGNLLHSMSRTLYEEVRFDRSKVTSLDWESYPMATIADVPDRIDKILINEPDSPPRGAGEETSAQTQPAIANAIFDATGVRMRRLPFTAGRVKAALTAHR
ncbi:MAG TPA: molybdopterin cofactor-binding domain-containing protein [Syntrophorhabdales bacterium]|nr:molybdopterin cofactor-binding domain-containing protein [Syntrophorhabdales bacterium]